MTIIYKGRLITVTMEKPEEMASVHVYGPHIDLYDSDLYHYRCNMKIYNEHLESLWQSSTIHASKELMERFKDGEELPEGSYEIVNGLSGNFAFPLPAVEEGSQDEVRDKLRRELKEKFGFETGTVRRITAYLFNNYKLTKI